MPSFRYPWPASALTSDEMALLYHARERSPDRIPITQLIREAVRFAFAVPSSSQRSTHDPNPESKPEEPVPEDRAA